MIKRTIALMLSGCQGQPKTSPFYRGDYPLPYGKWGFAFFTPKALPALVTYAAIADTRGYLLSFNTLDRTHDDPNVVGSWNESSRSGSNHYNQAEYPPQYMVFCWDSIIDKKVYETSLWFPPSVWQKMMTPADHKSRSGSTVWYGTLLFRLAPEGKVRVWLQNSGGGDNYPVPVVDLKTVSGDKLDVCKGVTRFSKGYHYLKSTSDFIKGKTYPYGSW